MLERLRIEVAEGELREVLFADYGEEGKWIVRKGGRLEDGTPFIEFEEVEIEHPSVSTEKAFLWVFHRSRGRTGGAYALLPAPGGHHVPGRKAGVQA